MKYVFPMVGVAMLALLMGGCGGGDTGDGSETVEDAGELVDDGSRLLVTHRTPAGDFDIYLTNLTGSVRQQLTTGPKFDGAPRWSPDGTRIAFTRSEKSTISERLYIMNADGSAERNLMPDDVADADIPRDPDWLDNDTLVYHRGTGVPTGLAKRSITSGEVTVLTTPGSGTYDEKPSVSPDGSTVAFLRSKGSNRDLYRANADGTNAHPIVTSVAGYTPTWSPDGTKIAFGRKSPKQKSEIYVANADGSNPVQLTSKGLANITPVWSPDGSKIIFVSHVKLGDKRYRHELHRINADGTGQQRLSGNEQADSPSGWR